jgi:hypothetical protein
MVLSMSGWSKRNTGHNQGDDPWEALARTGDCHSLVLRLASTVRRGLRILTGGLLFCKQPSSALPACSCPVPPRSKVVVRTQYSCQKQAPSTPPPTCCPCHHLIIVITTTRQLLHSFLQTLLRLLVLWLLLLPFRCTRVLLS